MKYRQLATPSGVGEYESQGVCKGVRRKSHHTQGQYFNKTYKNLNNS